LEVCATDFLLDIQPENYRVSGKVTEERIRIYPNMVRLRDIYRLRNTKIKLIHQSEKNPMEAWHQAESEED